MWRGSSRRGLVLVVDIYFDFYDDIYDDIYWCLS